MSEITLTRTPLSATASVRKPITSKADRGQKKTHKSFLKTFHSRFEPLKEVDTPTALTSRASRKAESYQSLTQPPTKPKFTLLNVRNKTSLRPRSEIRLLDNRMKKWETVNRNLQKLIPPPFVKPKVHIPVKPKPIITEAIVREVAEELEKQLEHFWNLYQEGESMTAFLRTIDGFTPAVAAVLMTGGVIQRIHDPSTIFRHFEASKPEEERSENFAAKDVQLHSALQYYSIKMEQKAVVSHRDYSEKTKHRAEAQLKSLESRIEEAQRINHW